MSETRTRYLANKKKLPNGKPEISDLQITKISIENKVVSATITGEINTKDIITITSTCWKSAVAEWLLSLTNGNIEEANLLLFDADRKNELQLLNAEAWMNERVEKYYE